MNETNVEPDAGVRESSTGQPLIVCTTLYQQPFMEMVCPTLRQDSLGVLRGQTAELAGADDQAARAGTVAGVLGIDPDRPARACGPGNLA